MRMITRTASRQLIVGVAFKEGSKITAIVNVDDAQYEGPDEDQRDFGPAIIERRRTSRDSEKKVSTGLDDIVNSHQVAWKSETQ